MSLVEPGFDASTFSKNRAPPLRYEVGQRFFDAVVVFGGAVCLGMFMLVIFRALRVWRSGERGCGSGLQQRHG